MLRISSVDAHIRQNIERDTAHDEYLSGAESESEYESISDLVDVVDVSPISWTIDSSGVPLQPLGDDYYFDYELQMWVSAEIAGADKIDHKYHSLFD